MTLISVQMLGAPEAPAKCPADDCPYSADTVWFPVEGAYRMAHHFGTGNYGPAGPDPRCHVWEVRPE